MNNANTTHTWVPTHRVTIVEETTFRKFTPKPQPCLMDQFKDPNKPIQALNLVCNCPKCAVMC